MGTPTEDTWPGVSSLPNYKPHKLCYYPPPLRLGEAWPRLVDVPFAESLATLLLQQKAQKRLGAEQALRHRYFAELPHKIFELDDGKCISCSSTYKSNEDRLASKNILTVVTFSVKVLSWPQGRRLAKNFNLGYYRTALLKCSFCRGFHLQRPRRETLAGK